MRPTSSLLTSLLVFVAACASPRRTDVSSPPTDAPLAASESPLDEAKPMRPPRPLDSEGVFYVLTQAPESPRVRYLDGQVSLNESCAIRRGSKLNRRVPPVYVNGQPIGFC
jgi:hypothetical protein